MPTVVGVDDTVRKRVTCRGCGSIIEYMPIEVRELWRGKDYGGGDAGAEGFNCPKCNAEIRTRSW